MNINSLTKLSAIFGAIAFGGIFLWGLLFQALQRIGVIRNPARIEPYIKLGVFILFLIFAFGCMPIVIRFFLGAQDKIGNADVGLVRFMREHFVTLVFGFWAFLLLGTLIAFPVMWREFFGFEERIAKPDGVVRARPSVTFDQVVHDSTVAISPPRHRRTGGSQQSYGEGNFDFEIDGLNLGLCQSYVFESGNDDLERIKTINVGLAPVKMTKEAAETARQTLKQHLGASGWRMGYFVYLTREDQVLHGATSERNDRFWSKDGILLTINLRRLESPAAGEDSETGGKFTIFLDICLLAESDHRNLQFEPPTEPIPDLRQAV